MIKLKNLMEILDPWTNFYLFNANPDDYTQIGMFNKEDIGLKPYLNKEVTTFGVVDEMLEIEIKNKGE